VSIGDTVVAGNSARFLSGVSADAVGSFTSLGHNLIGVTNSSSGWIGSDLTGTSLEPLNPLLTPLGAFGGPTQTMALLPGSPAIDAGTSGDAPATDQRGLGRIGAVDIGAFESQGFTLRAVVGSTPQSANIGTSFAKALAVTVTANNPIEPVNGGVVTFVPQPAANGASAIVSPSSPAVIAGGQAAVSAVPNNMLGMYQVAANASGSPSVSFDLTNTGMVFAPLIVNTTSSALFPGEGLLSLPEAVFFANADLSGNTVISFDPNVFQTLQTITLTGAPLELSNTSETETITGPVAGVKVSGGGLSGVFLVDGHVNVSMSRLTITGGNAGRGGGLYNLGATTLTNCYVSSNSADSGAGIFDNAGTLNLTNCTVSGNSARLGGGVYGDDDNTSLTNCTVSGNSAVRAGAGVMNTGGNMTLINCTVSGNATTGLGGGAYAYSGGMALINCTLSGNSAQDGGGLAAYGPNLLLGNTIVSGNTASTATDVDTFGGSLFSLGHNLIGVTDSSSGWIGSDLTGTGAAPLNPLLAPLGHYGGPTQTMALLPGSPAIDAGYSSGAPATDQRGLSRVGAVDIGAFESQGFTLTPVLGSTPQSAVFGTVFSNPLAVTVAANNALEPVNGGLVAFAVNPAASGASAILPATLAVVSWGTASVSAAANNLAGSYAVSASTSGGMSAGVFILTNHDAFINFSVAWGTHDSARVYTDPDGVRLLPAGRNTDIDWYGIKSFTIMLNSAARLSASDVNVTGITVKNYGPVTVRGSGATYTITLAKAISAADRVTVTIGNVQIPSFTRRLDVLPGDVNDDGLVNAQDVVLERNELLFGAYNIYFDLDGDGCIRVADYNLDRTKVNTKLPPLKK
jgi:hypothetical protein